MTTTIYRVTYKVHDITITTNVEVKNTASLIEDKFTAARVANARNEAAGLKVSPSSVQSVEAVSF